MTARAHILEERESLRGSFAGSVFLHTLLFASIAAYAILGQRSHELWGSPNAMGGGAMGVNIVKQIPLPSRSGRVNPVANDTQSTVPEPPPEAKPKPRVERPQPVDPDAIEMQSKNAKRITAAGSARNRWREQQKERPNQVYSSTGESLVSPMQGMTGSGGIGVGAGTLGTRCGEYVDRLRQVVGEKWRTGEIDARIKQAPTVVVMFTLQQNGQTKDLRVAQSSGNVTLDRSAMRAIADATPLPAIPPQCGRDTASIEFHFSLRR